MRKYYEWHFLFVVLIWTISGSLAIGLGFLALRFAPLGKWEQVPNPTEKAVRIITYDTRSLYVSTESEKIYICDVWGDICEEVGDQDVVDHPDLCKSAHQLVPNPPDKPIDQREFHLCGADMTIQLDYVILDDGTIWEWSNSFGWAEGLIFRALCVSGGAVGFVGGIIYALIKRRRSQVHNSK